MQIGCILVKQAMLEVRILQPSFPYPMEQTGVNSNTKAKFTLPYTPVGDNICKLKDNIIKEFPDFFVMNIYWTTIDQVKRKPHMATSRG